MQLIALAISALMVANAQNSTLITVATNNTQIVQSVPTCINPSLVDRFNSTAATNATKPPVCQSDMMTKYKASMDGCIEPLFSSGIGCRKCINGLKFSSACALNLIAGKSVDCKICSVSPLNVTSDASLISAKGISAVTLLSSLVYYALF
jgi:hypothetical protein